MTMDPTTAGTPAETCPGPVSHYVVQADGSVIAQTCAHVMKRTVGLRWLRKHTPGTCSYANVLQQADGCIACGYIEWADVPTVEEDGQ